MTATVAANKDRPARCFATPPPRIIGLPARDRRRQSAALSRDATQLTLAYDSLQDPFHRLLVREQIRVFKHAERGRGGGEER